MGLYRIKARRTGSWDFTIRAESKADAIKKAREIFDESKNVPQAVGITSIEKDKTTRKSISVKASNRAISHRRSKPRRR